MSFDIRLPQITGQTEREQLIQIKSYLYQLAPQLQWALEDINKRQETFTSSVPQRSIAQSSLGSGTSNSNPQATFDSIKALIIKSADIVNAYYETINARLKGIYVAESDFGTYTEVTDAKIEGNSEAIAQHYENIQQILSDIEGFENSLIEVNAHIKTGLLYYDESGVPVYGLEIGQRTAMDGVETFNKYARFTSEKLSFYDSNDNEVAYISDKKLYITHVEVTGSFSLGGFVQKVRADKSVVEKWVEGGEG